MKPLFSMIATVLLMLAGLRNLVLAKVWDIPALFTEGVLGALLPILLTLLGALFIWLAFNKNERS